MSYVRSDIDEFSADRECIYALLKCCLKTKTYAGKVPESQRLVSDPQTPWRCVLLHTSALAHVRVERYSGQTEFPPSLDDVERVHYELVILRNAKSIRVFESSDQ